MFRRSFQILVVSSIVALASIVLYASLQLRGAPETLAEAEAKFAAKQYARVIEILDICEPSVAVRNDRTMRQRLWRLRMKANAALENPRGALLDVENLLADGLEDDRDLQIARIRLLAKGGQGDRALQAARTFLAANAGDPLALEVAAEASHAATADDLERVLTMVRRDIGAAARNRARDLLMEYLHRADGDVEVALSIAELEAMYAADARITSNWSPLLLELRELRRRIQEGLQFCRDSLALGGEPTAAQREITRGLDLAGRTDDLLLQAEIFRRRFHNEDVVASGRDAVVALLRRGANAAALATAARWLPRASLEARSKQKAFGNALPDLLVARLVAAFRLDDRDSIRSFFDDFVVMQRAGLEPSAPTRFVIGLLHRNQQEWKFAEANLRFLCEQMMREPLAERQLDALGDVVSVRLDALRQLNAEDAILTTLNGWVRARPEELRPRLTLARFLFERGRMPATQELIDETAAAFPFDPDVFLLRVATHAVRDEQAGNGGEALYAQCVKRRVLVPDVAHPMGYVLCAQVAMARGDFEVARECARMAVEAFPAARLPRIYEINACLATDRVQGAVELSRRLVATMPLDDVSAWLVLTAHRRAKLPVEESLFRALPLCQASPETRKEALRSALQHGPNDALPFAVPVQRDPGADAELRLLAARALAIAGRVAAAREMLDSVEVDAPLDATAQAERAMAVAAWLEAAAPTHDDAVLQADAERLLSAVDVRGAVGPAALVTAAEAIADTHPETAYDLAVRAIAAADPEARSGRTHAFAGNLAARIGRPAKAQEHRLAALAFPDGRAVAPDLVRGWIAEGRTDRARTAFSLVEGNTDAALAAWAGDRKTALELARAALDRDGTDLVANAVLTLLGEPGRGDWQKVPDAELEGRIELLAMLGGTSCGAEALARAKAVANADPSPTSRLLLARALLLSGSFEQAAAVHTELLATRSPLLWRELALAGETLGYELPEACATALLEAMATGACKDSTVATVAALRHIVANVAAVTGAAAAQSSRELLWRQFPRDGFRAASDLPHLANVADARLAWTVLDAAANDARNAKPELRTRIREALFARAAELAASADDLTDVYAASLRHLAADGPYGCVVHFLLDHGERVPTLRPDDAAARALLRGQMELFAAGRDAEPWLQRSIARVAQQAGPAAAVEDLEAVLRRHPTNLALWRIRAAYMVQLQRGEVGIANLRGVLAHADAPAEQLAMVTLAAAANLPIATLFEFNKLPREVRTTPAGRFAGGLVLLRQGSPDDAIGFLLQAPPQPDGLHLFALALAHLQSQAANGDAAARECLQALERDYPSSSLARNAGNFATQLAPR